MYISRANIHDLQIFQTQLALRLNPQINVFVCF